MPYSPAKMPVIDSLDTLRRYIEEELRAIELAQAETVTLDLRPLYAEPLRPREGMIVFADGTVWDPGAGKGVYTYLSGAWSKL